jgi:hypothetical protein
VREDRHRRTLPTTPEEAAGSREETELVTSTTKTSTFAGWRLAAIGAVGALAVGAGVVAGAFLLSSRAALGAGAAYVPADAAFYVELRVQPSDAQDAALRDLLGRFPAIEGLDLDRPLGDQLAERMDEMLAADETEISWTEDIAPWFDGHVAVAVTDVSLDATISGGIPSAVVLLGVTDSAAANAAIERITDQVGAPSFTTTEHAGTTIHVASGETGAYAVTSDQVILGSNEAAVATSLDAHADSSSSLATAADTARLASALPSDWLAFAAWDATDLMTQALDAAAVGGNEMSGAMRDLLEAQPLRGAMAVTAGGDRISLDVASDAPGGTFAAENGDRGLADEIPGDVVYYSDAPNVGAALAGVIGPIKEAAQQTPDGAGQIGTLEAALGADLEELVSWIGDAAIVAGISEGAPYAGILAVPDDMDAAEHRLDQLTSFATLAAIDPGSGITVASEDVGGVTVTTIGWAGAAELEGALPVEAGSLTVELAVTEDRVLIGIGDGFVRPVLGLADGSSLADQARFTDAVSALGGSNNAGVLWIDIAGLHEAVGDVLGPMMPAAEGADDWFGPLDAFISVTRLDGEVLLQRAALLTQ